MIDGGAGYLVAPQVSISLPSEGNQSWVNYEPAFASSSINAGSVTAITIDNNYSGKGYTSPPRVEIEGGIHFLRSIEKDSTKQGKFFRILSNTGDTLLLENSIGSNLSTDFPIGSKVEVVESWTLGSLFGYNSTSFNEGNFTDADYLSLIHI